MVVVIIKKHGRGLCTYMLINEYETKNKNMKNLKTYLLLFIGIISLSSSCNEEPPTVYDPRDKLTGIFEMRKLEDGQTYTMKVEKVGELCVNCDSLKFTNYGNLFDILIKRNITDVDSELSVGIINPALDKYNKRWKLSNDGIVYPPYNYNVRYGDSLKIRFKLSNYLYYQEDGVPLVFDTILTHVGVKIADVE